MERKFRTYRLKQNIDLFTGGNYISRVGEVNINNKGTLMKIIKDTGSSVVVEFQDLHKYRMSTIYRNFEKGEIKNPYDITVFGTGYLGEGKYLTRKNKNKMTQEYVSWTGILSRCYYNQEKYPAYFGICSVCDEWLEFQKFAKWFDENKYECEERLHVDKDILNPDCKEYSPENCLLVPQRINALFISHNPKLDGLPHGITLGAFGRYKASYGSKSLGVFNTYQEACERYIAAKTTNIRNVAIEYKSKNAIPDIVYDAMMNYKVKVN